MRLKIPGVVYLLVFRVCARMYLPTLMYYFVIFEGCAMSGLIADSRTMVDKARVEAQVNTQSQKIKIKRPYFKRVTHDSGEH